MPDLHYFSDRALVSKLPDSLVEIMRLRGLIAPDHVVVHYCGFVSWQEGVAVFMPRNSGEEAEAPGNAFYLLQALKRYYFGKTSGVMEGSGSELIGCVSLSLASSLVEDYLENGLYVRRKKHHTLNQGRPDWKRTISRHIPFPSGGNSVFLELETSRTRYVSDCETARIHASVIREINRRYGVLLFGLGSLSDDRLEQMPEPSDEGDAQLVRLDRELSESYSERDIQLIGMLKCFIERKHGIEDSDLIVGTRKFHNVWEGMLDACLPHKKEINNNLPVPYYLHGSHYNEMARKGQRTDTVIESADKSRWAVIDAKYYDASSLESAPGWHDLVKQFFYKTAAEEICGGSVSVSLHFIFPGAQRTLIKANVGTRGQGKDGKVAVDDMVAIGKYGEVVCHYCNPLTLLRKYVNGNKLDISGEREIKGQIFPILEHI